MKVKTFQGPRLFSWIFQALEKKHNIRELSRTVGHWCCRADIKASNDCSPSRVTADAEVETIVYPMVKDKVKHTPLESMLSHMSIAT